MGSFIGGAGLFKFFGHPVYEIVGIMLIIISAIVTFVGIRKYRTIKKLISDIDPEDWQALEAMIKKDQKKTIGGDPYEQKISTDDAYNGIYRHVCHSAQFVGPG